ncbi:1-phosphatidylinositol 4,5-bisphosphate phosphodiesterase eta-2-like isoform X1 [Schistocerca cancellata]|uniref:1-phosphatidylinositol 4,5-bisphosphate phosphodiesterase eta-2-like isoform X1 n=1 Tax=Schistocerca cancellata TaxID=274614 RepID=UPI002117953A|nr:1-phosphatidylinositol 4,5-bisphosphate phosphodiesterase eta-2-like isoform X1 [Schistocerca cancellata]
METKVTYSLQMQSPEFRDAIDRHSKPLEETLSVLRKGTVLWKVRSYSKWYRRKYVLDTDEGTVRYEVSRKVLCSSSPDEIEVDDILDVRHGWKTDTFNKIAKKVEEKFGKNNTGWPPFIDEACCFSVIHGRNKKSLDLVATSPELAQTWVVGLRHIITVIKGLQQGQRFERWLKQQFQEADEDENGSLNFEECLRLLKQLNVKMVKSEVKKKFEIANTNKNLRDGEQVLDSEEFVGFFFSLMSREELKPLFIRYAKNSEEMGVKELQNFMKKEQHLNNVTEEQCLSWIEAFEQSEMRNNQKLSFIGFTNLLMSEEFEIFRPDHKVVYQDMSQPLNHYYIASSHNTYLIGGQLRGDSSVEGYISALKKDCRCVELDCWDGADGEPVIYHGYTLTSKILFRDVITDAIKPYAFHSSEYPLILSLENHCSEKQQDVLVQILVDVLGESLYMEPVDEEGMQFLPSPEDLKNRIIVKAKKLKPSDRSDEDDSYSEDDDMEDDDEDSEEDCNNKMETKGAQVMKGTVVSPTLSNIVNICQAVHFHGFEKTLTQGKCYQMSSFNERKAMKLIQKSGPEFVKHNLIQLSRIYPSGRRAMSSNYKPIPFWNVGCQIVALNYQSAGKPMFHNEAKFRQNGACGYVLKPMYLRKDVGYDPEMVYSGSKPKYLTLTVISGQHIPKPGQDSEGEIVDPYVKVKILGHPLDIQKQKTDPVRDNGFNPRWDCRMYFVVRMPELAMVQFIVKDMNSTGKDAFLGSYALPFNSVTEGYRHVYLMDYELNYVSPASLFVHVSIKEAT